MLFLTIDSLSFDSGWGILLAKNTMKTKFVTVFFSNTLSHDKGAGANRTNGVGVSDCGVVFLL